MKKEAVENRGAAESCPQEGQTERRAAESRPDGVTPGGASIPAAESGAATERCAATFGNPGGESITAPPISGGLFRQPLRCRAADVSALLALTRALYGASTHTGDTISESDTGGASTAGGDTSPGGAPFHGVGISTTGDASSDAIVPSPAPSGAAAEAVIRQGRCFGRYWLSMVELTGALCRPVTGLWPGVTAAQLCALLRTLGAEVV